MTNDIVVVGSGGHAISVTNVALSCGYPVISYVDDCQAGKKMAVVYENGDVMPCESLSEESKLGNLRDANYSLKNILNSNQSKCIVNDINPGKKCHCTWENAIGVSLLYDKKSWLKLLAHWFKLFILKGKFAANVSKLGTKFTSFL